MNGRTKNGVGKGRDGQAEKMGGGDAGSSVEYSAGSNAECGVGCKRKNSPAGGAALRLAQLLGGSVLLGIGIGICNVAGWGMDPLSVFADGVARTASISFSISSYLIYVLLAGAGWGLDRRQVTLWSFVSPFATSLGIEAAMRVLPAMQVSAVSLFCYLAGITVMSLGIALTIQADMGKSPYDAFIFALIPRVGKGYAVIRWGLDALWLTAGVLLGGVWGVGTVLALGLIGKLTEAFGRLLVPRGSVSEKANT